MHNARWTCRRPLGTGRLAAQAHDALQARLNADRLLHGLALLANGHNRLRRTWRNTTEAGGLWMREGICDSQVCCQVSRSPMTRRTPMAGSPAPIARRIQRRSQDLLGGEAGSGHGCSLMSSAMRATPATTAIQVAQTTSALVSTWLSRLVSS